MLLYLIDISEGVEMIKKILFAFLILVSCFSNQAFAELIKNQVFHSDGDKRSYDLYLPNDKTNGSMPMVLLLHGHFGDADVMTGENNKKAPYKVWLDIADREGWVLLIPDGAFGSDKQRGWNDCRADTTTNPNTDDVLFLNSLIRAISAKYPINKKRIYAHGTSNGGMMVYRLAIESGNKFKAMASIVASMPVQSECRDSNIPMPIMVMNGTRDPLVPYEGGKIGRKRDQDRGRGSVVSTDDTIQYWLENNGINSRPQIKMLSNNVIRDRSRVRVETYRGGRNNSEVVLYKVLGGGHTEPSNQERYNKLYKLIVGNQNHDIEMAEEVFQFFQRHR